MGQGQPFHRFDDIWCGLIMKKACDAMGWSVRSGSPMIRHIRASDAKRNAELEAPGVVENEKVWEMLTYDNVVAGTLNDYLAGVHAVLASLGDYWRQTGHAAAIWRRLVREGGK
jgi:hypothetical protein